MAVLLVAYDLNDPGQDYDQVLGYVRRYQHMALSESAYAIETDKSSASVYKELEWWADDNDTLYVVPLSAPFYAQGRRRDVEWLKERLA